MATGNHAKAVDQIGAEFLGPRWKAFRLNDLEGGKGSGAGDGVLFVGVMAEGAVRERTVQIFPGE